MLPTSLTQRILQRFPGQLSFCFAYGSGVKKQTGYDDQAQKNAMIDLILCVDNAYEWHKANLKTNPNDYSWMRFLGPKLIGEYQGYAAGVYCNTLIPIDKYTTIKYGVIETQDLNEDLYHWSHLYVAGRLHKPIETLVEPSQEIRTNIEKNFENVLHAALLLLPKDFTYFDLFHAIANISYHQDFRMYFGEKKDKVKNIVEPQLESFLKLYAPHLKKFSDYMDVPDLSRVSDKRIQQDKSHGRIIQHLEALPTQIHNYFQEMHYTCPQIADMIDCRKPIKAAIGTINWENSIAQSLKNIPTAGVLKSIRYSARKALKTFSK